MASANPMRDHISCAICFEVYKNPHVLKQCLHTFCLECIGHLKAGKLIRCPECRETSPITDIKKDFKTQRFVDLYYQQTGKNAEISRSANTLDDIPDRCTIDLNHRCEMCKLEDQIVKSKCLTCDQLMCEHCERTHKGMKICSGHKIVTVKNNLHNLKDKLQGNVAYLQSEKPALKKYAIEIEGMISNINKTEKTQLEEINQHKNEIIKKLEEHHKEISESVKKANASAIDKLTKYLHGIKELEKSIQHGLDFADEIINISEDVALLKECIENTEKSAQRLKNESEEIRKVTLISPVVIEKGEPWDPEKSTQVRILSINHTIGTTDPNLCFHKFSQNSFKEDKSHELCYFPQRLRFIDGKLYVVDFNPGSLHVYDDNCDLIKTISHTSIKYPRSMTMTFNNQIVVACDSTSNGLIQLDVSNPTHHSQISEGTFSDVCCSGKSLYALERNNCELHEFELNGNNKWKEVKKVKLEYTEGHYWDRLALSTKGIFVCSSKSSAILHYSYSGELQNQCFGGSANRSRTLASKNGIVLCQVDEDGNAIISDWANNCVEILPQSGDKSEKINLKGLRHPVDVVIDSKQMYLWVLENSGSVCVKSMLKRFKINQSSKKQVQRQNYST